MTAVFLAKLGPALDDLKERWAHGAIEPRAAFEFCSRCVERLKPGIPEHQRHLDRIRPIMDAAYRAMTADPKQVASDVDELARAWRDGEIDNLKEAFEEGAALLSRTQAVSLPRFRGHPTSLQFRHDDRGVHEPDQAVQAEAQEAPVHG